MFFARSAGTTLRRGREDARALEAVHTSPHSTEERFDPGFRTAMKCSRCGKLAYGPRQFMREAMREHWATTCPARHTQADAPMEALILYPKQ